MTHPSLAAAVADLERTAELIPAAHDAAWSPLRGTTYDTPGGSGDTDDGAPAPQPADQHARACWRNTLRGIAGLTGIHHPVSAPAGDVVTIVRIYAALLTRAPVHDEQWAAQVTQATADIVGWVTKGAAPPRPPRYRRCGTRGCTRPHHARGHCFTHYQRDRRRNARTA